MPLLKQEGVEQNNKWEIYWLVLVLFSRVWWVLTPQTAIDLLLAKHCWTELWIWRAHILGGEVHHHSLPDNMRGLWEDSGNYEYAVWETSGQCHKGAFELGLSMWAGFQHMGLKRGGVTNTGTGGDTQGHLRWDGLTHSGNRGTQHAERGLGCWWKERGRLGPNHKILRYHSNCLDFTLYTVESMTIF